MGQLPSLDISALHEFWEGFKNDPYNHVLHSWNEESINFNACPSPWNGILCNGGNIDAIFFDHLGLSVAADLSVFVTCTSMDNNSIDYQICRY
ncbi:hypothetical protein FXO38_33794 [Capsicum annuum]|uniref:Leucine-rich repeat-containing N-terminal plant-type domain-containing protein n=1 Tax=Capsicum annuum TaxID=4072 RepID=A0A2G2Z253_CAPAN|nr:hypothetical protein FXO38_33794 [Capsicum annuum]KAF3667068.1 hypothetical protein FXO37_10199 [Capsicum annuum]PHT76024.1 hypothetical protein T459_19546 [Capsicum annuum]